MGSELIVREAFLPVGCDAAEIREVVGENLAGGINRGELDKVTVPAGGGTFFSVPGIEGDEAAKELTGIIVHKQPFRVYWEKSADDEEGGSPPDCVSYDLDEGIGCPGGKCATCPFNKFGSHRNGKGKACSEKVSLFLLREGEFLPIEVVVPPTSLKSLKKVMIRLTSKRIPYSRAVVSIKLAKKGSGQTAYSVMEFGLVKILDDEDYASMRNYIDAIKPALEAMFAERAEEEL